MLAVISDLLFAIWQRPSLLVDSGLKVLFFFLGKRQIPVGLLVTFLITFFGDGFEVTDGCAC
jgi:hypothetical protein